ncbi:MAG: DEAD/DEAH box helicase [Pseudobacteriovorax sp.]|nr:DEAD/DEAH box helicase [Pseudobacteriovorax sp.]
MSWNDLLAEIREQCETSTWSQGVQLSRRDAVTADEETDESVRLRVLDRSLGRSVVVDYFPEDLDWTKDCPCKMDPCHHVAAGIIVLNQAKQSGSALPKSKTAAASINYYFTTTAQGLSLKRKVTNGETLSPLSQRLTKNNSPRSDLDLSPTKEDLAIDILLESLNPGILMPHLSPKLIKHLSLMEDRIFLDDQNVRVSNKALGLVIAVEDHNQGVRVSASLGTKLDKTFVNGWGLQKNQLHAINVFRMDKIEFQKLKQGIIYPPEAFTELVSQILPYYAKKKYEIKNLSQILPQRVTERPSLRIASFRKDRSLQVVPEIVYGSPPAAILRGDDFSIIDDKIPERNFVLEQELKDRCFRELKLEFKDTHLLQGQKAMDFAKKLSQWQGRKAGDGARAFQVLAPITPQITFSQNSFSLSFESGEGDLKKEASASAVFKAWDQEEPLVPLKDGGFAEIPRDWLQKYGRQIQELILAKESKPELPKSVAPQLIQLARDLGADDQIKIDDWHEFLQGISSIPEISLPVVFEAELRSYQKEGVNWLGFLQREELGALLADDMGLGKTLQTITIMSGKTLVVAPTSVIPNWEKEIARFRPNLKVNVYHGLKRNLDRDADVVITSYGLLRIDQDLLSSRKWDTFVLDEAQNIKNPESKVSQSAFGIHARFRIALSGTPVENRLDDLWSQMHFLNPGLLGSRQYFKDSYIKPILEGDEDCGKRLRSKIQPFFLRRLKKHVAKELPPKTEKVLFAELSDSERQTYDAIRTAAQKEVASSLGKSTVFEVLESLLRLRQACCHPNLIPGGPNVGQSAKVELLIKTLETALAQGHKALVFSQWTSFLDLISEALTHHKIDHVRLDGSTSNRGAVVDSFQANDGPPVMIMSLKAGGVGLNLSRADHVFIMDPWWNPAAEQQAADRAYRIGQENPVMVHPIIALDTIEERILALQAKKRSLAEAAIGKNQGALSITKDDILDLLADA